MAWWTPFVALVSVPTICIDPGHPSEIGWGTRGRLLTEVAVCWRVAEELKGILAKRGYRVVMTKSREQEFVTNRNRAAVANKIGAALMVRLHCDAGSGTGFAVYYPDRAGRDGKQVGPSPRVIRSSSAAARAVHEGLVRSLPALKSRGVLTDRATHIGAQHGALIGSIHSKVPTVLVEMCKLENRKDEAFFLAEGGYRKMAAALAEGVFRAVPLNSGRG